MIIRGGHHGTTTSFFQPTTARVEELLALLLDQAFHFQELRHFQQA